MVISHSRTPGSKQFLHNLGVPAKWQLVDVYGLDPDILAVVPRPVLAVLLLFPWSGKFTDFNATKEDETEKNQTVSDKVYFLKQVISNACGTIALIHSVANNTDEVVRLALHMTVYSNGLNSSFSRAVVHEAEVRPDVLIQLGDGHLKQFIDDTIQMNPNERGEYLLSKAGGIITAHKEVALEGQTEAPDENEPVFFHFVAFVEKEGSLYELDGRKSSPINHGSTSPDTLLEDAAEVCKKYIEHDPENLRFTVVALTAAVN
uniref:Ubiquitin carboxyl-terminal hydrolase n=1 Tax=Timema bartmani TaxID=61472 RepID=A0A7R9F6S7_9NEOP|nr:unnamed protein product [Timema bartmani]